MKEAAVEYLVNICHPLVMPVFPNRANDVIYE